MKIVTHDGPFHADDVFGAALLRALFPTATFVRSRDTSVIDSADIVFDVGGVYNEDTQRFDHHMAAAGKRSNGITYSAFGLLWRRYGMHYCEDDEDVWRFIDSKLVTSIDADDNGHIINVPTDSGVNRPTLDSLVRTFNPVDDESFDEQFESAVDMASVLLLRMKKSAIRQIEMRKGVLWAYERSKSKDVLELDHYVPVHDLRDMPRPLRYIICPEKDDRWLVCAVQDSDAFDSLRLPLPSHWSGLSGVDFQNATGLEDVQSCHRNLFIAVTYTREAAHALLRRVL